MVHLRLALLLVSSWEQLRVESSSLDWPVELRDCFEISSQQIIVIISDLVELHSVVRGEVRRERSRQRWTKRNHNNGNDYNNKPESSWKVNKTVSLFLPIALPWEGLGGLQSGGLGGMV